VRCARWGGSVEKTEADIGTPAEKRSGERDAQSVGAVLRLLCCAARSVSDLNEVVALSWDGYDKRFSTAWAADGIRLLWNGDLDSWVSEHPSVMPALHCGEDVSFAGRVLMPIICAGRLEGVLSITISQPFGSSSRSELQGICQLGALILAGLREREEAFRTISDAASELGSPLAAARGFTRMALEDFRNPAAAGSRSEYLSAALMNIDRLGEVAVGLQHARADA
jgi:hypothetical protein